MTAPLATAQNVGGTVSGVVQDATGGRLPAAAVTVTHLETSVSRTVVADQAGRYRVVGLTPGDHAFDVKAPGFAVHTQRLQIATGQTVVLDVLLQIATGHEEIRVAAPGLQRESSELGGVVHRELVLGLPVNGRSYEQLTLLEPGVVSTTSRETKVLYQHGLKININGAGSRSNAFLLDGTSVADLYNNGLGSVAGTFLGLEAVREFQVLTNNYQASYGGVSGGVVSIITKSGSRDLHGSAFGTLRDGRLDAKNYFDSEKPEFWRRQSGFSIGGRVFHDRALFFATGEWLRESMGATQVTTVPSVAARNGQLPDPQRPGVTIAVDPLVAPFLDLFPLPN
ncbi:MAG: TonB-dependent receptor, partial [Acidobacteria bacterium]|nr:TonB-dependent receptor [Acidobacteriota bacterium]